LNASFTASEIGWTVDEPEIVISPLSEGAAAADEGTRGVEPSPLDALPGPAAPVVLQAATARSDATLSVAIRLELDLVTGMLLLAALGSGRAPAARRAVLSS
jgi:hypothetical protein